MYLPEDASRNRIREAQKARDNRAEVVKARSHGQITRRDLFRWGLFTTSGLLLYKNGFSPYAPSAYAAVPTGTPRSPLFGAKKFTQPMQRLDLQKPYTLTRDTATQYAKFPTLAGGEYDARGLSYHTEYTANQPPLQELPHRTGSLRRPAARTDLRPPALGRISSQAWLRNVGWLGCAQHRALPSELALAESE